MNRYLLTFFAVLTLGWSAAASPSQIYQNPGVVTSAPTIDAVIFYNTGVFDVSGVSTITNFGTGSSASSFKSLSPFATKDTLYFTNRNEMSGAPGYLFETITSSSLHRASSFYNHGSITGFDTEGEPVILVTPGGTGSVPYPAASQPLPSEVLVFATNIYNDGAIAVGNVGLLQMTGTHFNLGNGSLVAGTVSDEDFNDVTGFSQSYSQVKGQNYFIDAPQVYDIYWGVSNALSLDLSRFSPPSTPGIDVTARGFNGTINFGNNSANFAPFVYQYFPTGDATNIYYNIVFVNTNFLDTNITFNVGFGSSFLQIPGDPGIKDGQGDAVEFSIPVQDIVTGELVTNSIYLLDSGALISPFALSENAGYNNHYSRPDCFDIATVDPFFGFFDLFNIPANMPYDPTVIYAPNTFNTKVVSANETTYGAQVGRDPEELDGAFSSLADFSGTNFTTNISGVVFAGAVTDLPDVTNEPARVEIFGNQVDITRARIRAEGLVTLKAANLTGAGLTASDWGNINADLRATNGFLTISNVFPTSFQRIRGDISLTALNWFNTQTNGITNNIHYHLLVVDQALRGNFQSTARDLALRAANVVVQDNLRVIDHALFQAKNLTFNNGVQLTQNAGNLTSDNLPGLKNFFNNTNGNLTVDSTIAMGFNLNQSQSPPQGRKYTVATITNFGIITATAPLFQSQSFENDGTIDAANGAMVIDADSIGLGLALTNGINSLQADSDITLSANSIAAVGSVILAGQAGAGQLTLQATTLLTDFVPGVPSTTSPLINFWEVTDGFSLATKPAGDLFGTQIKTIAPPFVVASHVWAGDDRGPTVDGFGNNVVIGRLVMDRLAPSSILHFSAAGAQNAMYVDYLELDDFSFSDYRNGLEIDPNFTIYFADANADPIKLEEVYPGRLVWVPEFAGPNSTEAVTNFFDTNSVCLINQAFADSPDFSFFDDGIPNAYKDYPANTPNHYPLNEFALGAPTPTFLDCADVETAIETILAESGHANQKLILSTIGKGTITPNLAAQQAAVGKTYTVTAVPAAGWLFKDWTGTLDADTPTLHFTLHTNVVLTATFIPNPFIPLSGAYNGLFYDSNNVTTANAGFFTFTVDTQGACSGKLLSGPESYSFSSHFSASGFAQAQAQPSAAEVKQGVKPLTVNMQLDVSPAQTGRVTGDVNAGTWDVPLLGDLAPYWTAKTAAPQAGYYTMAISGSNDASASPGGDSYGWLTVTAGGSLSASVNLADGTSFSQAVPVSKSGQWPFYAYVASGNDSLLGWIGFNSDASGFSGTVSWIKRAAKGSYYPAGFDIFPSVIGSRYKAPASHQTGLSLTNPVIVLSGGNLAIALTNPVSLNASTLTYFTKGASLSIAPASGKFTAQFTDPTTGRARNGAGILLRNENEARGYFPGTNESGSVLLQGD